MMKFHDHVKRHNHKSHHMVSENTLHVIGVYSNPCRWNSRPRLFRDWLRKMEKTPNVKVYVVEIAYGDRHHEVTEYLNPHHLQLRARQELWHKENMINLGVRHLLPANWKYMCWSDTDVFWLDDEWAMQAIHEMQSYEVLQPWATCVDMDHHGQGMQMFESFCKVLNEGRLNLEYGYKYGYQYGHTGYAWCSTRRFWENTHGLMDRCIIGSADHQMAWAMIGKVDKSIHTKASDGFKRMNKEWEQRAYFITHGHLGYLKTHIQHGFHGSKKKRYYKERWGIFNRQGFDPYRDLFYDEQGLLQLHNKHDLLEQIRKYNRSRNEDGIDV
jgi:hypothetical protein